MRGHYVHPTIMEMKLKQGSEKDRVVELRLRFKGDKRKPRETRDAFVNRMKGEFMEELVRQNENEMESRGKLREYQEEEGGDEEKRPILGGGSQASPGKGEGERKKDKFSFSALAHRFSPGKKTDKQSTSSAPSTPEKHPTSSTPSTPGDRKNREEGSQESDEMEAALKEEIEQYIMLQSYIGKIIREIEKEQKKEENKKEFAKKEDQERREWLEQRAREAAKGEKKPEGRKPERRRSRSPGGVPRKGNTPTLFPGRKEGSPSLPPPVKDEDRAAQERLNSLFDGNSDVKSDKNKVKKTVPPKPDPVPQKPKPVPAKPQPGKLVPPKPVKVPPPKRSQYSNRPTSTPSTSSASYSVSSVDYYVVSSSSSLKESSSLSLSSDASPPSPSSSSTSSSDSYGSKVVKPKVKNTKEKLHVNHQYVSDSSPNWETSGFRPHWTRGSEINTNGFFFCFEKTFIFLSV